MEPEGSLRRYLHGELSFRELQKALDRFVIMDFRNDQRTVKYKREIPVEITVMPDDLQTTLSKFINDELSAESLSIWASAVLLLSAYRRPRGNGRRNDAGEYMWEFLYELSAPPLEHSVTKRKVQRIIGKLPSVKFSLRQQQPNGDA